MKLDNENKTSSESTYPPAWIKQQHYLWVSYSVYLFIWISAFVIGICFSEDLGGWLFLVCVIPYYFSLVIAYKIQKKLYESNLDPYSHRLVLVWGILLTPFILGFVIPLTVIVKAFAAMKKLKTT